MSIHGCESNDLGVTEGATGVQGDASRYAILENDAIALPANLAGVVSSYLGADTTYRFYLGTDEVALTSISTSPASSGTFTYTIASEVGGNGMVITVTNLDSSLSNVYIDCWYTYKGINYKKRFNVVKVKDGV